MEYKALYRKWRPRKFLELIGQEHVTRTLVNALEADRVSHAYLFCGPRGTGKTSAAKLMAKALNCEQGPSPEPCGQCALCQGIDRGRIMEVQEIDAASNRGIDDIRELRETVRYGLAQTRCKVYIIDEVHMLTPEAFNALLKTLEEPPAQVIFILATTEPHKLPLTILSRCQRFDFHRIPLQVMVEGLSRIAAREGITVEEQALGLIARKSEGGMRDALGLLEQAVSFAGNRVNLDAVRNILGVVEEEVFLKLGDAMLAGNLVAGLRLVQEVLEQGRDAGQFLRDLTEYFRALVLLKMQGQGPLQLDIPWLERGRMEEQSRAFSRDGLLYGIEVLAGCIVDLRGSPQPRFVLESAVFQLCLRDYALEVKDLRLRVSRLEKLVQQLSSPGGRREYPVIQRADPQDNKKGAGEETATLEGYSPEQETRDLKGAGFKEEPEDIQEQPEDIQEQPPGPGKTLPFFLNIWDKLKEETKRKNVPRYSYLIQACPVAYHEGTLTVETESDFFAQKLAQRSCKDELEKYFNRFQDREIRIKFVVGKPGGSPAGGFRETTFVDPGGEPGDIPPPEPEGYLEEGQEVTGIYPDMKPISPRQGITERVLALFNGRLVEVPEKIKGGFLSNVQGEHGKDDEAGPEDAEGYGQTPG